MHVGRREGVSAETPSFSESVSPSVDLSSSSVREGCEALVAVVVVVVERGGRDCGVGLGDAGLGADPTEPALLGWP